MANLASFCQNPRVGRNDRPSPTTFRTWPIGKFGLPDPSVGLWLFTLPLVLIEATPFLGGTSASRRRQGQGSGLPH